MGRHAEFLSVFTAARDTRQLYARDLRTNTIRFLPEAGRDAVWADCKSGHLVCPVPGCDSPALTAVGGSRRRHHFRHLTAVEHRGGAESYYHLAAKAALGVHLEERYPEAHVQIDYLAVDNGQIPDLLVHFPDDRRYAIEIQYAPMTVEEWRRRHEGYRAQGIVDVWLFGHLRPHLRRPRPASFRTAEDLERCVLIGDLLRAVLGEGLPVRFINPDERAIATVLTQQSPEGLLMLGEPYVQIEPLDNASLDATGLRMPVDAAEEAAAVVRVAAETERLAEEARAAAAERRRNEQEARRRRFKQERLAEQARAWDEARPKFLAWSGLTEVPAIIRQPGNADGGIYWHPEHWKARLFADVIQGRIGELFTFNEAARPFWEQQPTARDRVSRALGSYLFLLRRHGYVEFESDGYFIGGPIRVTGDLHHPPAAPEWPAFPSWLDVGAPAERSGPLGFETVRGTCRPLSETGLPAQAMRAANGAWVHVAASSEQVAIVLSPILVQVGERHPGRAKLSIGWHGGFHDLAPRVDPSDELLAAIEQAAAAMPERASAA